MSGFITVLRRTFAVSGIARFSLFVLFELPSDCVASSGKQKQAIVPPNLYLNPNILHHKWLSVHACVCARTVVCLHVGACASESLSSLGGCGWFGAVICGFCLCLFCLLVTWAHRTWRPHAGPHTSHRYFVYFRIAFVDHLAVGRCTSPKCTKPHSPKRTIIISHSSRSRQKSCGNDRHARIYPL